MRPILPALVLPLLLAGEPALARAAEGAQPAPSRRAQAAPRPRASAPAPPRAPQHVQPRYAPRYAPGGPGTYFARRVPRWRWDPSFYGFAPMGWGWGWGYGYYPAYPRPEYGYAPEDVSRVTTALSLHGAGTLRHGGSSAGLVLGIEGERLGFHLGIDGLAPGGQGYGFDSSRTFAFVSTHLTVALLSTDVARLRGEIGASIVTWPDYGPDAGSASFGPDVGLSGQVGLVGPLGLEGYARVTPVPVPVYDWQVALALRAGPAVSPPGGASWRCAARATATTTPRRSTSPGRRSGWGCGFDARRGGGSPRPTSSSRRRGTRPRPSWPPACGSSAGASSAGGAS